MIQDSGNRTEFKSGAVRDIQEGKGRCDLLPLSVIGCWCEDSAYDILGSIDLYRLRPSTEGMSVILNKFASKHRNTVDTCKGLELYRWELVLEVAKHFEEGAKKYGDRNWEKGIPCDRYIDSAVRHYCKWSAGWTDEPHDRAFIWNILCCEWTRLRYGWNLERLETAKKYENVLGMKTELLDYKGLMSGTLRSVASNFNNKKRFTRSACLYLYDRYGQPAGRVWILDAYKSANLYAAIGNVWKESNDVTLKILEAKLAKYGWKPGVDFVVEDFDNESESKEGVKIGEQLSKGIQDGIKQVSSLYGEEAAKKVHWGCSQLTQTETTSKEDIYDDLHLSDGAEFTMTVEGDFRKLFEMLGIEETDKKDQDIDEKTDIKEALENVKKSLNCRKERRENFRKCLDTSCYACEYNAEPFSDIDALQTLIDYSEKSLKVAERHNPYVKDTDEGWHFYDKDGQFIGYIFKFKEPEEGRKRQLSNMIHKVWHEAISNPYTIKRIVEEWGYVCGKDFSICIAPSITAKEYDVRNRKYNEED